MRPQTAISWRLKARKAESRATVNSLPRSGDQERSGQWRAAVACQLSGTTAGSDHRHDYARQGLPKPARLYARRFAA